MKSAFILLLLSSVSLCALPPGYEDEIYCPPDSCVVPKLHRAGWSGPQSAFFECCNPSNHTVSRPKAWGVKVDRAYKDALLVAGWTTWCCDDADACGGGVKKKHALEIERVLDRVAGLMSR